MHPNRAAWLGIVSLGLAWLFVLRAQSSTIEHAASHVLVKFKTALRAELPAGPPEQAMSHLARRLALPSGATLERPALARTLEEAGVNLDRFLYLRLPPGLSIEQCLKRLEHHPDLEYAEPDGIGTGGVVTPNDPNYFVQWHHRNGLKLSASIRTPDAWEITRGTNRVLVAVLDTGVNTNLTEFSGRCAAGYNFAGGNANAGDDHGHGTAVAGVICANVNNAHQVAGVDWHCRLLPVKVLDANNSGLYSWWAQGIDYAVSRGAKVINLSAGGSSANSTLTRAITNAIARGVIFVTITHNHGAGTITFPGNLADSITVGATDRSDQRTPFSNYGPQIDLVAPGTNIATVGRAGGLQYWWGTSFAAPQVAGVCALLCAVNPTLNQRQARSLLCLGAEDRVGGTNDAPGFDNYYGWGRLNAYNSVALAQTKIDHASVANGALVLSWPSLSNASNRQPFRVEYQPLGGTNWYPCAATFSYSTNRTWWTNANLREVRGACYRLRLREN